VIESCRYGLTGAHDDQTTQVHAWELPELAPYWATLLLPSVMAFYRRMTEAERASWLADHRSRDDVQDWFMIVYLQTDVEPGGAQ
jgi:hypothetical protein